MPNPMSFKGLCSNRQGSSFVEFAILFPVLLFMCCGTMDFARLFFAGIEVANAARSGVQFGALTPGNSGNTSGMAQAAINDATDLGIANVTANAGNFCACDGVAGQVACSSSCSGATPIGYVQVTASYTFNTLVHYPGLPQSVVLTRTANMRVQ